MNFNIGLWITNHLLIQFPITFIVIPSRAQQLQGSVPTTRLNVPKIPRIMNPWCVGIEITCEKPRLDIPLPFEAQQSMSEPGAPSVLPFSFHVVPPRYARRIFFCSLQTDRTVVNKFRPFPPVTQSSGNHTNQLFILGGWWGVCSWVSGVEFSAMALDLKDLFLPWRTNATLYGRLKWGFRLSYVEAVVFNRHHSGINCATGSRWAGREGRGPWSGM